MQRYVPVVGSTGKKLMPTTNRKANKLIERGRALRRFDRGLFYIKLVDREDGYMQSVACGIDPGSKKEGFTIKSEAHTFLNIQADAVTWVRDAVKTRREMRRGRRFRKTPYRKCRLNRNVNSVCLPPSTMARWGWKLRICKWLSRYFPVESFVVEDIAAETRPGKRKWNVCFGPLEVGKSWFYAELGRLGKIEIRQGYETKALRDQAGLKKSTQKMSDKFSAHCVDSWVLANWCTGGHVVPENEEMVFVVPLRFYRRQLHRFQPAKGGIRIAFGGTRSLGFKRGDWVKHFKYGVCYVGGMMNDRISLHQLQDGKRLCQNARVEDCKFLTHSSWRVRKRTITRNEGRHG